MFGEMLDTSPEARRFYYAQLARLSPRERLAIMASTSRMVRRLAEAGIRKRYPGISEPELKLRLAVRLYGREMVEPVLGMLPPDAK
jgi:hypothetical protein